MWRCGDVAMDQDEAIQKSVLNRHSDDPLFGLPSTAFSTRDNSTRDKAMPRNDPIGICSAVVLMTRLWQAPVDAAVSPTWHVRYVRVGWS